MIKIIRILLITMTIFPALLLAQPGRDKVLEGNKFFHQEKFDEAINRYQDALLDNPNNSLIRFNIGNTLYKKNKYEEALNDFEKSLSIDDVNLQAKAYYNMGNTLYRMGKLPESILAYTQSLKLNPDDEDAKYNLEFVRSKLKNEAQKQSQSNQQQQQQQQSQGEDQEGEQQPEQQQPEYQDQDQQQQQEQPQPDPQQKQEMTKEEAERILQALSEDDKDLQETRKSKKTGSVRVIKDW
ncbi:MAG TPA: tetratricopeptide repeat protein [bacterium]|nr:tetratricopeptide repeat protein [bacterium]